MAERHPRSIEQFRTAILKECDRPGFAEAARYSRPVGGGKIAEGPSIRFIEGAIRAFRNLFPEVVTVFDNDALRICRASVTDLEANITYSTEVQIRKAVERRGKKNNKGEWEPPKGRDVVGNRLNSYGDMTYLVLATEDEVIVRQNALLSKAIRTNAQRLLPADVIEECMQKVIHTQREKDAKDPDAAKRKVIDSFFTIGVQPDDLEQFLQTKLERIQPKDLEELRAVYSAIKDGQTTWEEMMRELDPTFGSREEQDELAKMKLAALRSDDKGKKAPKKKPKPESKDKPEATEPAGEPAAMTEEEMRADQAAQDAGSEKKSKANPFGRRSQ
jgi:hypothetical protein